MTQVLILDDEPLISTVTKAFFVKAGFEIMGPYATVAQCFAAFETQWPDAALLDINLTNEYSFPVAQALDSRGIPFAFLTGYETNDLASDFPSALILNKTLPRPQIVDAIKSLLPAHSI